MTRTKEKRQFIAICSQKDRLHMITAYPAPKRSHNESPENGELMASPIQCCAETRNTCCTAPLACTTKKIVFK